MRPLELFHAPSNDSAMTSLRTKIVFFLPSLGGGGAEMHLLRVLNHARWNRLEPHLMLARHGGAYERSLAPGIPLQHLLPKAVKSSTLSLILACWPLRRQLRRLRPAVVCSLLNHATVAAHLALPRNGARPVFLVGIQNNPNRDLKTTNPWLERRIQHAFERADHFVALSHGVSDEFKKNFPRWSDRISVIYNAGFDDRVLNGAGEALDEPLPPAGAKLLVSCGRLTPQKNQAVLLQALAAARKQIDVRLWILGRGELRSQLEALACELGIAEAVRFLDFRPNPFKYMARADGFVLSSDWEGFGNVLVEAMALNVPVISTACPFGPPEIIRSEETGLLVPVGAVGPLADAMVRICSNRNLADRLARAGRQRAEDFHAERIANEYEQLLEQLADRAGRAPARSLPRPAIA